jgi:hypothetical protein
MKEDIISLLWSIHKKVSVNYSFKIGKCNIRMYGVWIYIGPQEKHIINCPDYLIKKTKLSEQDIVLELEERLLNII